MTRRREELGDALMADAQETRDIAVRQPERPVVSASALLTWSIARTAQPFNDLEQLSNAISNSGRS